MVQVPIEMPDTVLPVTVQFAFELLVNVTGNPEEAVALTVPVPPTETDGAAPNVMLWLYKALLLKVAVTFLAASIISVQLALMPLHAPLQPAKVLPEVVEVAIRVSIAPLAILAEQVPEVVPVTLLQLIPPVLLLTVPLPLPAPLTESR
jgi:hypothetical protein